MIFNCKSLCECNFKIKKPFFYGNKVIFDLFTDKDQLIYIESPSLIISNKSLNDNNTELSVLCHEYNTTIFTKKILNVIDKILIHAKKKYEKMFYKKIYKSLLKNNSFQFYNIRYKEIGIYNKYKEQIDINNINADDRISIIIHIKNIWIQNLHYGINIDLIQIRRDNYIDKTYLFLNYESDKIQQNKSNKIEQNKLEINNEIILQKPVLNFAELLSKRNLILKLNN
jgi:hypothetical protein